MKLTNLSRILICLILSSELYAQNKPVEYIYSKKDSVALKAYLFFPDQSKINKLRSAIVIFHGGGWVAGEPSWGFWEAQHFADLGMVSIVAQYRLSNQKDVTPLEAMMDAREIIRWVRINCDSLKIDPNGIVAFGWSAGGHLAASSAVFPDTLVNVNSIPNALVLISPAVSITKDKWAKKILLGRIDIKNISPDENIRKGLPPTIILQGRDDTVTPLTGVKQFTDRMLKAGNKCELIIYDGVGHLFTPSGIPDYNQPQPDKKVEADAYKKIDKFLSENGFLQLLLYYRRRLTSRSS